MNFIKSLKKIRLKKTVYLQQLGELDLDVEAYVGVQVGEGGLQGRERLVLRVDVLELFHHAGALLRGMVNLLNVGFIYNKKKQAPGFKNNKKTVVNEMAKERERQNRNRNRKLHLNMHANRC